MFPGFLRAAALAAALSFAATPAGAIGIGELIGERVEDRDGIPVGFVQELIVDTGTGRVVYIVVATVSGDEYHSLPLRALRNITTSKRLEVDMALAGTAAIATTLSGTRLRRASRLIGARIEDPGGVIHDLGFEPRTGLLTRVEIATADGGRRDYPASILSRNPLPPPTR